jgi:phytoene synthase
MKGAAVALTSLLAMSASNAFISRSRRVGVTMRTTDSLAASGNIGAASTYLHSLAPSASRNQGRSDDEIKGELSSGKIMEGGKVIDFEAIKGPSSAEQALEKAKQEITSSGKKYVPPGNGILGINSDVVSEVGHELAQFASPEEIQLCASYLRSQAPESLFEKRDNSINGEAVSFSAEEKTRIDSVLRKAFVESGEVTSAFAKTFYLGTQLLSEAPREAIWAIYVWCRRTDEIVDAPRDNDEEMLKDLGSWEMRLEDLWKYGAVEDVYDLCVLDVLVKYPKLPITPFTDMIRGMLMDVPRLGQERYETFDELHLYCYRVAGTVGLMSLPVFGCAEGYNDKIAR